MVPSKPNMITLICFINIQCYWLYGIWDMKRSKSKKTKLLKKTYSLSSSCFVLSHTIPVCTNSDFCTVAVEQFDMRSV